MTSVRGLRATTAYVVWGLSLLLALGLAGAALLVALKADPGNTWWGPWLRAADAITPGWFARPSGPTLAEPVGLETVFRWGAAALLVLVVGAVTQWVVRPPRR